MQLSPMKVTEAEIVLNLWNEACVQAVGHPLPPASAEKVLDNLRQYAQHEMFHCWVARTDDAIVAFITFGVRGHPIGSGLVGKIEELYAQPEYHAVKSDLIQQAVVIMKRHGAGMITTRVGIDEDDDLAFWQSLQWEQDTVNFNIYSNVPADPDSQAIWDSYKIE